MKGFATAVMLFAICLCAPAILAQKETFDIATCTPPKDFKKELKQGLGTINPNNSSPASLWIRFNQDELKKR